MSCYFSLANHEENGHLVIWDGPQSGQIVWRPGPVPKPGIMINKRNHPKVARHFRLVNYYNLPIYTYIIIWYHWVHFRVQRFLFLWWHKSTDDSCHKGPNWPDIRGLLAKLRSILGLKTKDNNGTLDATEFLRHIFPEQYVKDQQENLGARCQRFFSWWSALCVCQRLGIREKVYRNITCI